MTRHLRYEIDYEISVKDFLRSKRIPSKIISLIKRTENGILVNKQPTFINEKLTKGDVLQIKISEEKSSEKIPFNDIDFEIVFEDEDILVINKPYGVASHPSLNHFSTSLASGVMEYVNNPDFVYRCVNRLDKDTSGLTIIAKNRLSSAILVQQVKEKSLKRKYLAIVNGKLVKNKGSIIAPIARTSDSIIEREVNFETGEYAKTNYEVIRYINGHSLLELELETGRTHQIRVHLKHVGNPIIGDFLYNPDYNLISRQALHSKSLEFLHPITFENMYFECQLPHDMEKLLI